jgi:hypothetical protein
VIKRASVVQRAVELIGPKPEDRETCELHIKHALWAVENERRDLPRMLLLKSRKGKDAALRLQRALENLRDKLDDVELPADLRVLWIRPPLTEAEQVERLASIVFGSSQSRPVIDAWRDFVVLRQPEAAAWLTAWIDRVASVQKRKPSSLKLKTEVRKTAARAAHDLMLHFNFSRRFPRKRFILLAELLHGHPDPKIADACRKVRDASVQFAGKK